LFYNNKNVAEKIMIIISNMKIQSKERILNELLRIAQNSKLKGQNYNLKVKTLIISSHCESSRSVGRTKQSL
jgi:hypothetical protein